MKRHLVNLFLVNTLLFCPLAEAASWHHSVPADGASSGYFSGLSPSANRKELTIRQIAPLEFGMFTSGNNGGNVTIDPKSGARITSGDIAVLNGNYGRAEFEIIGQPGEEVMLYFQPNVSLTNGNKSGSASVTKFITAPAGIIRLDQRGHARVGVGAVLHAAAHSDHGQYSGMFTVDARYVR